MRNEVMPEGMEDRSVFSKYTNTSSVASSRCLLRDIFNNRLGCRLLSFDSIRMFQMEASIPTPKQLQGDGPFVSSLSPLSLFFIILNMLCCLLSSPSLPSPLV